MGGTLNQTRELLQTELCIHGVMAFVLMEPGWVIDDGWTVWKQQERFKEIYLVCQFDFKLFVLYS